MVRKKTTEESDASFKSGYVMLLGRPNVGKSTLLNAVLGEELSIVTPKPQTTRNRILGIHTQPEFQIIFLDTPGIVKSERGLKAFLSREVQRGMADADVILFIVEPFGPPKKSEQLLLEKLAQLEQPILLVINKVDKVTKDDLLPLIEDYNKRFTWKAIVPVSSTRKHNLDTLVAQIIDSLPEGPMFFPQDQLTDASERFLVAEMIREQVFLKTQQEIPFSSAVLVQAFKEAGNLVNIQAEIFVEREGQKPIIIGKNGAMLKEIGTAARHKMEDFLGKKVFLELYVKVKKDWTRSDAKLREMGYE